MDCPVMSKIQGYHKGKVIIADSAETPLFQPVKSGHERITWGKPAQIAQAKETGRCYRCNSRMDIGRDKGVVFGGICHVCGFSF